MLMAMGMAMSVARKLIVTWPVRVTAVLHHARCGCMSGGVMGNTHMSSLHKAGSWAQGVQALLRQASNAQVAPRRCRSASRLGFALRAHVAASNYQCPLTLYQYNFDTVARWSTMTLVWLAFLSLGRP